MIILMQKMNTNAKAIVDFSPKMNAPREDAETLKCFCTRDSYLAQTKVNKQWQAGAVEHGCSG